MAIKGRNRSHARRGVTPGPKPAYVPVKKPLLQRRSVQITALVVLVLVIAGILAIAFVREREQEREDQRQQALRTAAAQYQASVDRVLAGVGQPVPPTGFQAFPTLQSAIDAIAKGAAPPEAVAKAARDVAKVAGDSARAMDDVDVVGLVRDKGLDRDVILYMTNAKGKMTEGLRIYVQAAKLVEQAATATGEERAALLESAQGVLDAADAVFSDGYSDYVQVQSAAGVLTPTLPPGAGAPIPTGQAGG